jgi:hypothetical protein
MYEAGVARDWSEVNWFTQQIGTTIGGGTGGSIYFYYPRFERVGGI